MLDLNLSATVSDHVWESASERVTLPQSVKDFFDQQGAAPVAENTRRRYRRVFVRGRGIVLRGNNKYGAYTIDVSPMGVGFFAPLQLLPKEKIGLLFEESGLLRLEIRRCVRTGPNCYSCGGNFLDGPLLPGACRNFLAELSA